MSVRRTKNEKSPFQHVLHAGNRDSLCVRILLLVSPPFMECLLGIVQLYLFAYHGSEQME